MNNDGPPSRPSRAHCPPEPLRTVALSLPHSAHHPTPPHDTAAVRQGQRARGRRRKERERGGARSTQQHRTVHTPTTPHTHRLPLSSSERKSHATTAQRWYNNATSGATQHTATRSTTHERRARANGATHHSPNTSHARTLPPVRAPPPPAPSLCHRRVARNAFSHPPEKRKQATYIAQPRCGTAWAAAAPTHHTPFSPHSRHLSVAHRHARPTYRPVACGQDDGACSSARGKGPPASD